MPTLVATRRTPSAVLVSLATEEGRAPAMRIAARLRERGIACEVAPSAAKFGKQIKFADRRGIPFVWFPEWTDAEGICRPASVKDIRSGEQVEADPETWTPPTEDLFPQVVSVI